MINERTEYRSGPRLVQFFNELGFRDTYGPGFPSRWMFSDEKLSKINGTPRLDECIRKTFAPVNFVGKAAELDRLLEDFNQYLSFDLWRVERKGATLEFKKLDKVEFAESKPAVQQEDAFLKREFAGVAFDGIGLEPSITRVLSERVQEIERCFAAGAHLAVILLAGSTIEGALLGLASTFPREFNSTSSSPTDSNGKVRSFQEWSLSNFIDVARKLSLLEEDTQKFSHVLRDFRNYIHPYQQLASGFSPREHTARICLQVLRAASHDLRQNVRRLRP